MFYIKGMNKKFGGTYERSKTIWMGILFTRGCT